MNKLVKSVLEQVFEITFSNLQVHTARFVIFSIQRFSGLDARGTTILARCKFKASGVKFVGILTTRIYDQLKNL